MIRRLINFGYLQQKYLQKIKSCKKLQNIKKKKDNCNYIGFEEDVKPKMKNRHIFVKLAKNTPVIFL